MSRLMLSMLAFCLLSAYVPSTEAAGVCNFRGISDCWNDILSKYCENGVCEEEADYCSDKNLLIECFQVNCDSIDGREHAWVSLFTGVCSKPFSAMDKAENEEQWAPDNEKMN